jgi:hypothetical protein
MAKTWTYDGSIEKWPIKPGERWSCQGGTVMVNDLYRGLPDFMRADLIFVDPPWNVGNENSFRTKAQLADRSPGFSKFLDALFVALDQVGPSTCFMAIGKQYVAEIETRLRQRFPVLHTYAIVYYRKHPCFMVRGGQASPVIDYTGMDENDAVARICREESFACVADICMGRGTVGVEAFRNRRQFVGTELNPARLAVMINKISEMGGAWRHDGP